MTPDPVVLRVRIFLVLTTSIAWTAMTAAAGLAVQARMYGLATTFALCSLSFAGWFPYFAWQCFRQS